VESCHSELNYIKADNFDRLAIIILVNVSPTYSSGLPRAMFLTTYYVQYTNNKKQ